MLETLAQRIVDKIIHDLNDRKGLHIDDLDENTQKEIRDSWIAMALNELKGNI